jgi:branched-chain amino acid aminotransferase
MVWLNGALIEATAARIDITDRGFLLADGLFETLLARNGHIRRLDEHLERMHAGAGVLGIPVPVDLETIGRAAEDVLVASNLGTADRASLRITLTRGPAPRGVLPPKDPRPTLLITAATAAAPPDSMTAITSKTVRRDAASPLSSVKSLAYTGNVLARLEAEAAGADEALVLNTDGNLAETTASNVFLVEDGRLVTPPVSDGALPGIERETVIERAQRLRVPVLEETVTLAKLRNATEMFLTSSLIGICPLTALDGRPLKVGTLTERLRKTA